MVENLPSNSNKSRLAERTSLVQETLAIEEKPVEREPVKSVVKGGTATRKKRGILSKFCSDIFAEDISNVGETVRKDFIIPMIKQGIFDTVTNALRLWLKVDGIPYNGIRSSIFSNNGVSRIAYSSQFDKARNNLFQPADPTVRRYLCDPVDGLTKQEAMDAVRQLDDIMSLFHMVRVADFYDTCGITPASTDHNYGWTDISDIRTTQLADGTWRITMPKPELLQTN